MYSFLDSRVLSPNNSFISISSELTISVFLKSRRRKKRFHGMAIKANKFIPWPSMELKQQKR